jgi:hypothetical protein
MVDDCGGIWGFEQMIQILQSKSKDTKVEREEYREWLGLARGEAFEDLYNFDIDDTNQMILEFFNQATSSAT